jgi:hypothetical protein
MTGKVENHNASEQQSKRAKIVAAWIVVLLGVATIGYFVSRHDNRTDRELNTAGANTGCTIAAAGVGALAMALSRGRTGDEVLRLAGPVLTGSGCTFAVGRLRSGSSAELGIKTDTDVVVPRTVTLPQLTSPALHESLMRHRQCAYWKDSKLLFNLCVEGKLSPPR